MNSHLKSGSNVAVTLNAAEQLSLLRERYEQHLKFHLFLDENKQLTLRIHDRVYLGDWIVEINGVGVSFSTTLISYFEHLVLDCVKTGNEENAFEFKLFINDQLVSSLSGEDAIRRIESEEVEVCDAYGEFCYTTYS